jgi:hypothetical protein
MNIFLAHRSRYAFIPNRRIIFLPSDWTEQERIDYCQKAYRLSGFTITHPNNNAQAICYV